MEHSDWRIFFDDLVLHGLWMSQDFKPIPYANHGAGILTNIGPCPKSPSHVGKYGSTMEHWGYVVIT